MKFQTIRLKLICQIKSIRILVGKWSNEYTAKITVKSLFFNKYQKKKRNFPRIMHQLFELNYKCYSVTKLNNSKDKKDLKSGNFINNCKEKAQTKK